MARREQKRIVRRKKRPLVVLERGPGSIAMLDMAHEWGWDLLDLYSSQGSIPDARHPSGALVRCVATDPLAESLQKMGCPMVRRGLYSRPQDTMLPTVLPDRRAAGTMAAVHFAERNFKQIAFVSGQRPIGAFRPLYEQFRLVAADRGMSCQLMEQSKQEAGESNARFFERRAREFTAWLSELPKPIGIFTYSDQSAARLCIACRRAGVAVPEEVALLGLGNGRLTCELAPIALSSVDTDQEAVSRRAMLLLRSIMNGESAPANPIMVPPSGVVERQSTNVLAVPDPAVAQALRFMWDHLARDLLVEDVVREVGVPRHRLERAFRRHLDRGINAELTRRRLEVFRRMLLSTDAPICELAPEVGFNTMVHLRRCFRRAYGMSAREYRATRRMSRD